MSSGPNQGSLFDWLRGPKRRRGVVQLPQLDSVEIDAESAAILHVMLEDRLGTVDLVVTDNRRRMVSVRRKKGRHEFRVHHMFLGCDDRVAQALVGMSKSDEYSRTMIREFVDQNRDNIRQEASKAVVNSKGSIYDLDLLLSEVLEDFDDDALDDITITWGRRTSGKRSIRFGSFDFEQRLIRINPALDATWVPRFFVEFVVYHEVLHAVIPPKLDGSRRVLHPPEFREQERCFDRYDEAISWERENLHRLLS